MEIEVRTKEQQAIDNLKAIVNSKDKIIEIEPPIEDTAQILLDYITNLQNKLEEKTYLYNKLDIESKYAITNLQEENERLKIELSGYREAILKDDKLLGLQEYKSRNEKAIEYCKKSNLTLKSHYFSDLLNILGGDDND